MKFKNKIIFIICILSVIIGGFMPYVSSYFQDYYLHAMNDTRVLDVAQVSVNDSLDVKDVLTILASEYDCLEYNGDTNLSILNIGTYAKTITEELIKQGLLPEFEIEDATIKANVSLINPKTSYNYSQSADIDILKKYDIKYYALIWQCDFIDIDNITYSIVIDDSTGKFVSLYYSENDGFNSSDFIYPELNSSKEDKINMIEKYNTFFSDYYNIDTAGLVEVIDKTLFKEYRLPIVTEIGEYEEIELVFYNRVICFNY